MTGHDSVWIKEKDIKQLSLVDFTFQEMKKNTTFLDTFHMVRTFKEINLLYIEALFTK